LPNKINNLQEFGKGSRCNTRRRRNLLLVQTALHAKKKETNGTMIVDAQAT
jgi:hypothetical protein